MADNQPAAPAAPAENPDIQDIVSEVINEPAEEADQEASAPASEKEMEKAINNMKKKLKLKVDGEEIEEEIDLADEEGLKRHLQKAKAFDRRVSEYSSFKKQVDQLMEALKTNPASILQQLGHNIDDLAENHLKARIEEAKKSPEQIAREKMEKELKEAKEEAERLKKEKEDVELERMRNEHATMIESDIKASLDKAETILPKNNPTVIRQIAQTMLLAMKNGYPNVTAKDVIPVVEDQFKSDLKVMFDAFPEEIIEALVGKNNLDRLRKKRIKEQKNTQTANQIAKPTNSKPVESEKPKQKKDFKKVFNLLD